MASTKEQRRAAGKKAAQARRNSNQLAAGQRQENPHDVDLPEDSRDTEADALESYGVSRDAHDEPWVRPSQLFTPEPRKGMTQRWIRMRIGTREDVSNTTNKFREGWLPRRPETVAKGDLPPTTSHSRLGQVIGVGDLILCEMPISKAKQRNAYYKARIDRMVEAIDNDMNSVSRHGPRINKRESTKTTYRARRRAPADPTE